MAITQLARPDEQLDLVGGFDNDVAISGAEELVALGACSQVADSQALIANHGSTARFVRRVFGSAFGSDGLPRSHLSIQPAQSTQFTPKD